MTPNPTDSKAVAMVHSGEPVAARFARAFAEAPVTVQPAGPAAEVFVLEPIVRAPTVMAQLEVKDLWPRSGLPRSGPSQRPGEELSNWFLCGYFACHSFKRWTGSAHGNQTPTAPAD